MTKPLRGTKGIERVIRYAKAHDWHVERTRGGHIRFVKAGCPPVFTGYSPSDARAEKNALARLRRVQRHEEGET